MVESNARRSESPNDANDPLEAGMRVLGEMILAWAGANRIPAGSFVAVDQERQLKVRAGRGGPPSQGRPRGQSVERDGTTGGGASQADAGIIAAGGEAFEAI
jgi:hypothetical protein